MAKQFIKKNWQKDATSVLVATGIRGAGSIVSALVTNKLFGEGKSKTMQNIGGPVLLAVGILGDMMLDDPKLRAGFQGVANYSLLHTIAVISPGEDGVASKLGVQGLGVVPSNPAALFSGIGALGTTTANDTPPEFALAAGQKTVQDTDGKTYNNDWAYLAENIDHADDITKTVNGVNVAQQAADLMGVEPAEAVKLMGMF